MVLYLVWRYIVQYSYVVAHIADIDECVGGTTECDSEATCINTIGGYNCSCNSGYEGDGFEGNCSSEFSTWLTGE